MKKSVIKLFLAAGIVISSISPILAACAPHKVITDQTGAMLICTLVGETTRGLCVYDCSADSVK